MQWLRVLQIICDLVGANFLETIIASAILLLLRIHCNRIGRNAILRLKIIEVVSRMPQFDHAVHIGLCYHVVI